MLLRRSARYLLVRRGLVTLAIGVGVGVTVGFARIVNMLSRMPGDQLSLGLVAGSIFGGVLALVGQRAWQPAAERLDRAFFRSSFDARRLLEVLADQSRLATDRAGLAELIDRSVVEALHPQSLLVFLRGTDDGTFEAAAHEGLSGAAARMPATQMQLQELMRRGRPCRSILFSWSLADGGARSRRWRPRRWCRWSDARARWKACSSSGGGCRTSRIPARTATCWRRSARRPAWRSRTSGWPSRWRPGSRWSVARATSWRSRGTCRRSCCRRVG